MNIMYLSAYIWIVMALVAYIVYIRWKPKKIYFEYGEYVPASVQIDLDAKLVFINGTPVAINRDWAKRVIAGKDIRAWKMEDGVITEMDLENTSEWVIPIDKSLGAKGRVIRSSKVLKDRIATQRKRENIEACLGAFILFPSTAILLSMWLVWIILGS